MSSLTIYDKVEQGLSARSKAEQILFNSIKESIEMFEDSPIEALINTMCSDSGISEIKLLTNYDSFEKVLRQTLCYGANADIILDFLKEKMLQYSTTKRSSLTINDIMTEINNKQR